jgi:hypothetical protein
MHLMSTQSVQIAEQGRGKLVLVPVIFVVLRIWGTIRFILFASSAHSPTVFKDVMITLQVRISVRMMPNSRTIYRVILN